MKSGYWRTAAIGCALMATASFIPTLSAQAKAQTLPEPFVKGSSYVPWICKGYKSKRYTQPAGELPLKFCEWSSYRPKEQQRQYYDFMWQSFIALNWPADLKGIRGEPDLNASILDIAGNGDVPVTVWETYRTPAEIFLPPKDWGDKYPDWNDPRKRRPSSPAAVRELDNYLGFLEYATSLNQPDFYPDPTGPLIDQNKGYVRYEVAVNQAFFTYVKTFKYYDAQQQIDAVQTTLSHPESGNGFHKPPFGNEDYVKALEPFARQGFVDVKAAWRVLGERDHRERYLHRMIHTEDGVKPLGLVALHILRWTPNGQPETQGSFVAATFEQVDNVRVGKPAGHPKPPGDLSPSFNPDGGKGDPVQQRLGFQGEIPKAISASNPETPIDQRKPVSIYRVTPIPSEPESFSVADANEYYQLMLKDSVFSYYELIGTQNKRTENTVDFKTEAGRARNGHQGPVTGVYSNTSNLVNSALESYTQANHSCIQCHVEAAPQGVPTEAKELDSFRTLTFLLQSAQLKPLKD